VEVRRTNRGPQVIVSRSHPGLIKRLFENEVPEIKSGIVEIKGITREAGYRTKMAVYSKDEEVDPVGACVGQRGMRVERVVAELGNERIDIVPWSDDPAEFIANSLSPAKVSMVRLNERDKVARIIVADNQLSLAIGREGQNARLAAKLTGWKIDIKSQSQVMAAAAEEAMQAQADDGEDDIESEEGALEE
jgi:N utilization substance protein A